MLISSLRDCLGRELIVAHEYAAPWRLVLFEAKIRFTESTWVVLAGQLVVINVDFSVVIEVHVQHSISIHVNKFDEWHVLWWVGGRRCLAWLKYMQLIIILVQAVLLLSFMMLLNVNFDIVLVHVAWFYRLLHENFRHAIPIEIQERVGMRRRNEAFWIWLDTLSIIFLWY